MRGTKAVTFSTPLPIPLISTLSSHVALVAALLVYPAGLAAIPPANDASPVFVFEEAPLAADSSGVFGLAERKGTPLPSRGTINAVVLFAGFEGTADPIPDYAEQLFDVDMPGSFSHYYATMSRGNLKISGQVVRRRYTSARQREKYLSRRAGEWGHFDRFVQEILEQADPDVDFGEFDNDGPDGLPNSGDDDGEVDFPFVLMRVPRDFLIGGADAVAQLGFDLPYLTDDLRPNGTPVLISGRTYRGAVINELSFTRTVGIMTHEFGHGLGLPDLYSLSHLANPGQPASADHAGIGFWGLMGRGSSGWGGDRPSPMCAWSLEKLGWISENNDRLVEVRDDTTDLLLRDPYDGGAIAKVPLRTHWPVADAVFTEEYLLLETRSRSAHYYNENMPSDGLLIWHVRPQGRNTQPENDKFIDLVCADGLYGDSGFPAGRVADPLNGGDNLDFWTNRDPDYLTERKGNIGDETDLFDGERYVRFDVDSNPSSRLGGTHPLPSPLSIAPIRKTAEGMVVDIRQPRWSGTITDEVRWRGHVVIDGDLTVGPGARLIIHAGTHVRVASRDRLGAGSYPEQCEIMVEGALHLPNKWVSHQRRYMWGRRPKPVKPTPVLFAALARGGQWAGLFPGLTAELEVSDEALEIRDALYGFLEPGQSPLSGAGVATVIDGEDESSVPADPDTFGIGGNFPNPFDELTTIEYSLHEPSQVQLVVYNSIGQALRTLVDEYQFEGEQQVTWDATGDDGRGAASGVYLYRLTTPTASANGKMLLMKGYAHLSELDESLRHGGGDWNDLEAELTATDRAAGVFGVAAPATAHAAALAAGRVWIDLNRSVRYGPDEEETAAIARSLRRHLVALPWSPAQATAWNRFAGEIRSGAAPGPETGKLLLRGEHLIAQVLLAQDATVTTYFATGRWLQMLRVSCLVSMALNQSPATVMDVVLAREEAEQLLAELAAHGASPNLQREVRLVKELLASGNADRLLMAIDAVGGGE